MKKIIVTTSWDDGHILDLRLANLLKKHHIKATFYVCPNDREFKASDLLSRQQIILLSKDFEIGAHTVTHPKLNQIESTSASWEISESKKILEEIIKRPVVSFCYPGGFYDNVNVLQVKEAGFVLGRTTERFRFDLTNSPFQMPTSIHAYRHFLDLWKIARFAKFNPVRFLLFFWNWELLAIEMFERTVKTGGVFHLWGHSWEIEKNNDWERLEKLLTHIESKTQIQCKTNGELYE